MGIVEKNIYNIEYLFKEVSSMCSSVLEDGLV